MMRNDLQHIQLDDQNSKQEWHFELRHKLTEKIALPYYFGAFLILCHTTCICSISDFQQQKKIML
jgi:hypothetical protein